LHPLEIVSKGGGGSLLSSKILVNAKTSYTQENNGDNQQDIRGTSNVSLFITIVKFSSRASDNGGHDQQSKRSSSGNNHKDIHFVFYIFINKKERKKIKKKNYFFKQFKNNK
jgi:hypothetical protein